MRLQKLCKNVKDGEEEEHRNFCPAQSVKRQKRNGKHKALGSRNGDYCRRHYQIRRNCGYAVVRHRTHSVKPQHIRQIVCRRIYEETFFGAETAVFVNAQRRYHRNEGDKCKQVEFFDRERREHQKSRQRGKRDKPTGDAFFFYPLLFLHRPKFLSIIFSK